MVESAVVTGGAGFIGSHLVDLLLSEGTRVFVIDDLSSGSAERVPSGAELVIADITDVARLDELVDNARPDAIYHLAAQSSVTRSVADPRRDADVNVLGTLAVVEAAKRHRAPVVFTSTGGALYGNEAPIPTPEDAAPRPLAPYGASKWAGEAYVITWAAAGGIPHAVCRLGNVYGPRQSPHGEAGVVAIFSHKLWTRETPTVYGFGKPTRDYVHVFDVARALAMAATHGGTFNIATGTETSVREILTELETAAGFRSDPHLAPLRSGELQRSCMDPGRARDVLGWATEVPLDRGLRETYTALVSEFESGSTSSD